MFGTAKREPDDDKSLTIWQRLHAALMPDYNRNTTIFWWFVVSLGCVVFVDAGFDVWRMPVVEQLQLVAGVLLAVLVAMAPVKVPNTNQVFSIGDVFIVFLLLVFGTSAGCMGAGLETFASSWRSSKRWTSRLGSLAIATTSMRLCGQMLESAISFLGLLTPARTIGLVLSTMVFGILYATCSALLLTVWAQLKRGDRLSISGIGDILGWVGAASAGTSALAGLLFIMQRLAGMTVMLTVVPIVGLVLTTLYYFTRQQEAEEQARNATARALERDAELKVSLARQREAEQRAEHLRALETSERRFQSAFTQASIGMALVTRDGLIHQCNPALRALLGTDDQELEGRNFFDHIGRGDQGRLHAALAACASQISPEPMDVCCRRTDGSEIWASISCSEFSKSLSDGPTIIMQIQDFTARHKAEIELLHRASHDKLTGLPNRVRFHEALSQAILTASEDASRGFAVLFLDFDRFKLVNDSKGHTVGDEFLVRASKRLLGCLDDRCMLSRLGGDEFAILAEGMHSEVQAVQLAEQLLTALQEPLQLVSMEITASASIGITFSSIGYEFPEEVLRDADIAMYRAKLDGKARYALFDVQLHTEVTHRVRLEGDLRQALAQQALSVAFQPLFNLRDRRLVGFEALARWVHPELGPVSPVTFIPIAEDSGFITHVTEFVLNEACHRLRQWTLAHPDHEQLTMHVNVAARDLTNGDFVRRVQRALDASGLAPRQLVVELTENILMAQLAAAMSTLKALRELGIGLSVDDFGAGYSSLSHLAVLPIDSLKIDMSFVHNLSAGSTNSAVIRAIVLLAVSLEKKVIAEGIETQSQLDVLRELGCSHGQGFYLARPLSAGDVEALLAAQDRLA